MPAPRRVSIRQMELLVEFAESNPDIALGRFPGGPQAVRSTRNAWDSVAVQLNSVAEGTTKTPDQWRRYWIEFKAKTKSKAVDSRRNASATGGGPNKLVPLTELEKRVLAIIGPVAVEGLPGVRLPISIPSAGEIEAPADAEIAPDPVSYDPVTYSYPSTSSAPISQSSALISFEPQPMNEEWLDEEMHDSPFELPPSAFSPSSETRPPSPPTTQTQPALPLSIEVPPAEQQPPTTSRDDRFAQRSQRPTATAPAAAARSRSHRRTHRDEEAPRWAYEIESRRIAAQERHADAMELLVELIREIRNAVLSYLNQPQ